MSLSRVARHNERQTCSYPSIFTPWGDEIDIVNASSAMECPSRYPESFSKVWRRPELIVASEACLDHYCEVPRNVQREKLTACPFWVTRATVR